MYLDMHTWKFSGCEVTHWYGTIETFKEFG